MGAPVLVDDGGSIRIKQAKKNAGGVMDSLFTIVEGPNSDEPGMPANSKWSKHEIDAPNNPKDYYSKASLFYVAEDGTPITDNLTLNTIKVTTDFGLTVELKKIGAGEKLKLMISSEEAEPILESRQHKGKRSYVVVNGGRIVQVSDGASSKDLSTAINAMVVVS